MALTQTEKYDCLRYCGHPIRTIDSTSMSYSKIIADRLTTFPSDAETILREMLGRVETIDEQLESMVSRSNLKKFEDIEFFENGSSELRRDRSKVIREIACLLDIPLGPGAAGGMSFNVSV